MFIRLENCVTPYVFPGHQKLTEVHVVLGPPVIGLGKTRCRVQDLAVWRQASVVWISPVR